MSSGQASPADKGGGEFGEAFMHEQVPVPADGEAPGLVEVGGRVGCAARFPLVGVPFPRGLPPNWT